MNALREIKGVNCQPYFKRMWTILDMEQIFR